MNAKPGISPRIPSVPLTDDRVTLLTEMHTYMRPHGSTTENDFVTKYLKPIASPDAFGNMIAIVPKSDGSASSVMWSSHTDTVHDIGGRQALLLGDDGRLSINPDIGCKPDASGQKRGRRGARKSDAKDFGPSCLGADCTVGVWIMLEMIQARIPGLYVFHRGEECGGLGSSYIAQHTPELLSGIEFAIAFDRKGMTSIITHQAGERTASDEFADSLAKMLPGFMRDSGGVFTDTANYSNLVAECTNISVGYYHQHSQREFQDINFIIWLSEQLINWFDEDKLTASRDPFDIQRPQYVVNHFPVDDYTRDFEDTCDFIQDNADVIAGFLEVNGITLEDILNLNDKCRQEYLDYRSRARCA